MIGRLLHYEIVEKIGEGGMGIVYKARDKHLGRMVAIKVLPPGTVADPERKRRFVTEAKAAAALNHPNIVHVYDIDSQDGVDFIVMEYVPGRSLHHVISPKKPSFNETLNLAIQIADALSCAHLTGIVHRDLKPANVIVDEHGSAKVLDFGLAKLREPAGASDPETTLPAHTVTGAILGTPAYMSPEQAAGKPVDSRSDIFSFGSLLYEMLAGTKAFRSQTIASLIAAILTQEPEPLSDDVPPELQRIVYRCLRKDPARRFQHMADVKVALEEMKEESNSGKRAGVRTSLVSPTRLLAFVIGTATLVLLIAGWLVLRRAAAPVHAVAFTSYTGDECCPSFSPDGKQVAFVWNGENRENADIYVQLVGSSSTPLRLTSDPAPDVYPAWSPDGTQIAFIRQNAEDAAIYMTSPLGGAERKLVTFHGVPHVTGCAACAPSISWSPDGKFMVYTAMEDDRTSRILLISAQGGAPRTLVSLQSAGLHYSPALSPNSKSLAFSVCSGNRACDIYVVELRSGFTPNGEPRRITSMGATVHGLAWSEDGKSILYSAATDLSEGFYLWRIFTSKAEAPVKLDLPPSAMTPAISSSSHQLAYAHYPPWDADIVKLESGHRPTRFLSSTLPDYDPQFSPDGKKIAFASGRSGQGSALWVARVDGTGAVRLTAAEYRMLGGPRWSPDSRWIVYNVQAEDGRWHVHTIDSAGGLPRQLTSGAADEVLPAWSNDGKWIYYASKRTGRSEIYRMSSSGGEPVQLTKDGGTEPMESPDGRVLYFKRGGILRASAIGGGPERELVKGVLLSSYVPVTGGIYYVTQSRQGANYLFEFQFFDLATRKNTILNAIEGQSAQGLTISPDRKTALYSVVSSINFDLKLVENFH